MATYDITLRLQIPDDSVGDKTGFALESLADVMRVQAEDGLWTAGYEDADTYIDADGDEVENVHVAHIWACQVQSIVRLALDLDTESSASRQHYIDTGRYLLTDPEVDDPAITERIL